MRTIRRIYLYLMSFASLEVVIWGLITLARTLFTRMPQGGVGDLLASGLSLVLVGVPIFLVHWTLIQRDVQRDVEERTTWVRAFFLYAVRYATQAPVVLNLVAFVNRSVFQLIGVDPGWAFLGGGQAFSDNAVAIVVNLTAWFYFQRVLTEEWKIEGFEHLLRGMRRVYRYLWMFYCLFFAVGGAEQLLLFLFYRPEGINNLQVHLFANGIALLLTGIPLWVWAWRTIQNSLEEPGEGLSSFRMAALHFLSLGGALVGLVALDLLLLPALRLLLGEAGTINKYFTDTSTFWAVGIPAMVIWAYFSRQMGLQAQREPVELRRAGALRVYTALLALLGNGYTFFGLWRVIDVFVGMAFGGLVGGEGLRSQVGVALAALLVGLPVWLRFWRRMQKEAGQSNEIGEDALRSVVRKTYLYLVLFLSVGGVMASAGTLFYLLFSSWLSEPEPDLWPTAARRLGVLILTGVWLLYHLGVLRQDGKRVHEALGGRHAEFPAAVFQVGQNVFTEELAAALKRAAPRLPLVIQSLDQPLDPLLETVRAVVLPGELAINPPETLQGWLNEHHQPRVVVPDSSENITWLGTRPRSSKDRAKEAALAVRQLAEGQPVRVSAGTDPWVTAVVVLGVIFGLQIILVLLGIVMSFVN